MTLKKLIKKANTWVKSHVYWAIAIASAISGFIGGFISTTSPLWWAGVERWQTLITGFLAIFGAAIGAAAIVWQFNQRNMREDARDRAKFAKHLKLPFLKVRKILESVIRSCESENHRRFCGQEEMKAEVSTSDRQAIQSYAGSYVLRAYDDCLEWWDRYYEPPTEKFAEDQVSKDEEMRARAWTRAEQLLAFIDESLERQSVGEYKFKTTMFP